jgi:hypothetical protein
MDYEPTNLFGSAAGKKRSGRDSFEPQSGSVLTDHFAGRSRFALNPVAPSAMTKTTDPFAAAGNGRGTQTSVHSVSNHLR